MATKKITDLQLRSSLTATCNFPVDDTIQTYRCTAAQIAEYLAPLGLIPSGGVIPYGGTSAPTGWLLCNGASLLRASYPTLFSAIGTAHGAADGTHFNLPDYRGRFLRGVDGAVGRDADRAGRSAMATGGATGDNVGSVQDDATAKNGLALSESAHNHSVPSYYSGAGGNATVTGIGTNPGSSGSITTGDRSTGISLGAGDSETRPLNAYVNYIIKT